MAQESNSAARLGGFIRPSVRGVSASRHLRKQVRYCVMKRWSSWAWGSANQTWPLNLRFRIARLHRAARRRSPAIRSCASLWSCSWCLGVAITGWFSYYYVKYGRIIELASRARSSATPPRFMPSRKRSRVGEKIEPARLPRNCERAGYSDRRRSPMGSYRLLSGGIEIKPGPQSYHSQESATIRPQDGAGRQHHRPVRRPRSL